MEQTTLEDIDPPANVLFVHEGPTESDICQHLRYESSDGAILRVSFSGRIPERRPDDPSTVGHISVGIDAGIVDADAAVPDVVEVIEDPANLSALGISISQFCEYWGDKSLAVCFDSLDAMLDHSEPKTVFEFTYVLAKRLANVGALAHFHFDTTGYEEQVVATFGSIFDEVVVDETTEGDLPEATDEDVAAMLEGWGRGADSDFSVGYEDGEVTEATDEDIAKIIGE